MKYLEPGLLPGEMYLELMCCGSGSGEPWYGCGFGDEYFRWQNLDSDHVLTWEDAGYGNGDPHCYVPSDSGDGSGSDPIGSGERDCSGGYDIHSCSALC